MSLKLDLREINFVVTTFDIPPYYIFIVQDGNGAYLYSEVKTNIFEL